MRAGKPDYRRLQLTNEEPRERETNLNGREGKRCLKPSPLQSFCERVQFTAWGPPTQQHPVDDLSAILENARIGGMCVHHKHDLSEIQI